MTDGVYTSFFELPNLNSPYDNSLLTPTQLPRTATLQPSPTSTFDALMKLKNLAECIDDAIQTQAEVAQQIETFLREKNGPNDAIAKADAAMASATAAENAMKLTKREVQKMRAERDERRGMLDTRRTNLKTAGLDQGKQETDLAREQQELENTRAEHAQTRKELLGQTRRIAQHLLDIFPIEPIEHKPLCFTILDHHLPNAKTFENEASPNEEATAAALGYVCEIVTFLEQKFEIPLPYSISCRGSSSDIFDPLSPARELGSTIQLPPGQLPNRENSIFRIFPLYQRGTITKRFNWGVYLLNKNIEELMSKNGLKIMDPRNTLANVKYLLTVLSSGSGQMPQRKAGEIKGLVNRHSRILGEYPSPGILVASPTASVS